MIFLVLRSYRRMLSYGVFSKDKIGWFEVFRQWCRGFLRIFFSPELLDPNGTSGKNMMSNFDGAICFFNTAGTHRGRERFFSKKKNPEKFVDNEPGAIKADFQLLVVLEHHILDDWRS